MSEAITKSRDVYTKTPTGRWRVGTGAWMQGPALPPSREGIEKVLYTKGNPGPPYRSGSGFTVDKYTTQRGLQYSPRKRPGSSLDYDGFYVLSVLPTSPSVIPDQTTTLFGLGATGIARARPDKPITDLATFLGELRHLPGQLYGLAAGTKRPPKGPKGSAARPQGPGSTLLGIEFGLLPTVRDLIKLYEAQQNMAKTLEHLRRNNGRDVRRRIGLFDRVTSTVETQTGGYVVPSYNLAGAQTMTITRTETEKSWFSGKFRYYVPELDSSGGWPPALVAQLYGANPSLEVLWNLTPWSWLIDWFGNTGDIIRNISLDSDYTLMRYGYAMSTLERKYEYSVNVPFSSSYGGSMTLHATKTRVRKQRVFSFPYGFGPTPGSLNSNQLAILGALGLSALGY